MKQTKRLTGEERKDQIAEAAKHVFSRKGFAGTKTREIAEAAGVSEATIFKHFKNKDDLYRHIIRRISKIRPEDIATLQSQIHNVEDLLKELVRRAIENMEKDPDFIRLMLYSFLEESEFATKYVEEYLFGNMEQFTNAIERGIGTGLFRRVDPKVAAQVFANMIGGYCLLQNILGQAKPSTHGARDVVEAHVDMFLQGLRKR